MAARASASSQGAVHDEPKKSCGEQCCTLLLPLRLLLVLVKFPFWLIGIVFAFIIALFGLLGFIITLPARCFMKEASDVRAGSYAGEPIELHHRGFWRRCISQSTFTAFSLHEGFAAKKKASIGFVLFEKPKNNSHNNNNFFCARLFVVFQCQVSALYKVKN
eukprot:m.43986 g.43986  ORF g.43986 m.43986 type:complete len:162 (+) comp11670_c0_seq4:211-696(+)